MPELEQHRGRRADLMVVGKPRRAPGRTELSIRWNADGAEIDFLFRYEPNALVLAKLDDMYGECTFASGYVWLKLPLEVGSTWSSSDTCRETGEAFRSSSAVVRTEWLQIGGERVRAKVVRTEERRSRAGAASWVRMHWYADDLLELKTSVEIDLGEDGTRRRTRTLASLRPEAGG